MAATDVYQLYRVSNAYYREGLTQEEISVRENISRSQISRMLERAREMGIVRIEVVLPEEIGEQALAEFLKNKLHLMDVFLASVEDGASRQQVTDAIAQTAAANLPRLIRDANMIGLGWGETVYRTASFLKSKPAGDKVFVPMIGTAGCNNPYLQINTILDRFAERFHGDSFFANLTTYREKNVPLTAYETKRLRMMHEYWDAIEVAIVGVGTRQSALGAFDEEVNMNSRQRIEDSEVVGDILSHFFFADGTLMEPDEAYHTNAYPAERLRDLPRSICLAGGIEKTECLLAAARAGFYNTLVTDSATAQSLYERIRSEMIS